MYFKRMFLNVFIAFIAVLLLSGCKDGIENAPDTSGGDNNPVIPPPDINTEIEYIYLGDADNLLIADNGIVTDRSTQKYQPLSSTVQNSVLLTIDASGDIKPIAKKGGNKKTLKKALQIGKKNRGQSKVKAAIKVYDEETGAYEYHLVDRHDRAHKLKKKPKGLSHRLKNAATFWERGNIYYIDESSDLVELDISDDASADISHDQYVIVRSGVEQAVMDVDGNWMLALTSGQVVHRDASGSAEARMNDNILSLLDNAEVNKLFMAQGSGFLFRGDGYYCNAGVFFRAFLNQGQLEVISAQGNDETIVCFYPDAYPNTCAYQKVGDEELLICSDDIIYNNTYVYQLGDVSNDMRALDFQWVGHLSGGEVKAAASSGFVYYYSNSPIYDGSRLTRVDLDNQTCRHLFSRDNTTTCPDIFTNTEYLIDQLTVTDDDTVRFCGHRLGEEQLLLVEIVEASSDVPELRETEIEACEQLINL